jgi:hypothetical protein
MTISLDNLNTYLLKYSLERNIPQRIAIVSQKKLLVSDFDIIFDEKKYYFTNILSLLDYLFADLTNLEYFEPYVDNGELLLKIYNYVNTYNSKIINMDIVFAYVFVYINVYKEKDYDLENLDNINLEDDINILPNINQYLNLIDHKTWNNYKELIEKSVSWEYNISDEYERDKYYYIGIKDIQNKLLDTKLLYRNTPIDKHGFDLIFNPKLKNGEEVQSFNGSDIFNDLLLNPLIFYARYNDELGNSHFKIYDGTFQEEVMQYEKLLPSFEETNIKEHLYLMMSIANIDESPNDLSKDYIQLVKYNLNKNTLVIRIPVKNANDNLKNNTISRLTNSMPNIDLGIAKETNITADFIIWGWKFDDMVLADAIINEDVLQAYLYADEKTKPFAQRKRVDFKYRSLLSNNTKYNFSDLEITLSNHLTTGKSDQIILNDDDKEEIVSYDENIPYVRILITDGNSPKHLNEFIKIFPLLVSYYETISKEYTENLLQYFPKILDKIKKLTILDEGDNFKKERKMTQVSLRRSSRVKRDIENNEDFLEINAQKFKKYASDLFVANYIRRCEISVLPTIILPNEFKKWQTEHPSKQYIPYPPPIVSKEPRFYLTCLHKKAPYINIKYNKHLSNRATHQYFFCCHPIDRTTNDEATIRFKNYYNNIKVENIVNAKARNIIVTQRLLPLGGLATLPYNFSQALNFYNNDLVYLRYGTVYSTDSLIHALLIAVQEEQYIKYSDTQRKEYVKSLRQQISDIIELSVGKQEYYDEDLNFVKEYLLSDLTLDVIKYYRIFEELFAINIFIVGLTELGKRKTGQEHKDTNGQKILHEASIQIPRHQYYHYRVKRDRPTVLIYRNFGSEADGLENVQSELIVALNPKDNTLQTLHDKNFGNYCYELEYKQQKLLHWLEKDNVLRIYHNIDAHFDYQKYFASQGFEFIQQYLDNFGKVRAFVAKTNDKRKLIITLIVFPTQPLNLPEIRVEDLPISEDKDIINIFGESNNGYYPLADIEEGFYIITKTYNNILYNNSKSPTEHLTNLRRTLTLIQQLLLWCYGLFLIQNNLKGKSTDYIYEFIEKYLTIYDKEVTDSNNFYNLNNLTRILPKFDKLDDALKYLNKNTTNLIKNDKIVMYNDLFYQQISDYLRHYTASHQVINIENYLHNYYYNIINYKQDYNTQIFFNPDELMLWLDKEELNRNKNNNPRNIYQSISLYRSILYYPYFYQDDYSKKIYLIQNVISGDFNNALSLAKIWASKSINMGFLHTTEETIEEDYLIYGLSPVGKIIALEYNGDGQSKFLEILAYTNSYQYFNEENRKKISYAALMPLN